MTEKKILICVTFLFFVLATLPTVQVSGRSSRKHDFCSQFLLFILLLFFPFFWEGGEKGKRITKVVVKSHAFLLDLLIIHIFSITVP